MGVVIDDQGVPESNGGSEDQPLNPDTHEDGDSEANNSIQK